MRKGESLSASIAPKSLAVAPVSMFVTVMTTFGTAAPVWSKIVPSICPFKACDWAKADDIDEANNKPRATAQIKKCKVISFIEYLSEPPAVAGGLDN